MKNIGTNILLTILLSSSFLNIAGGQCSFDFDVVIEHSSCVANGKITVSSTDSRIDLQNVFINISGRFINEPASDNGHSFGSLPAGTYTIKFESTCAGTTTPVSLSKSAMIENTYNGFGATQGSISRPSLNCINSGILSVNILRGKAPYKIEITVKPEKYTGNTVFTYNDPGEKSIENLAPGEYSFTVSDNCSSTNTVKGEVLVVEKDFPVAPYESYLYPSSCYQAYVLERRNYTPHEYWNSDRSVYEVAFSIDDKREWSSDFSDPIYIDLPASYIDLYGAGKEMEVYLRLKDAPQCKEEHVGSIKFSKPPEIKYQTNPIRNCKGYQLEFELDSAHYIMCTPLTWEILDESNKSIGKGAVDEEEEDNSFYYYPPSSAVNLSYSKPYTLKITDRNGYVFTVPDPIIYGSDIWIVDTLPKMHNYTYDLAYVIFNMCTPYNVEISDGNDLINIEKTAEVDTIKNLEYDKVYTIKMSDGFENKSSFTYTLPSPDRYLHKDGGRKNEDDEYTCETYGYVLYPQYINTPYTWTLRDMDGKLLSSGTCEDDHFFIDIPYDVEYKIEITDKISTIRETILGPPLPLDFQNRYPRDYQCDHYDFVFNVDKLYCLPYKWELFDSEGKLLKYELEVSDFDLRTLSSLEYNTKYTIKVTDSKGHEIEWPVTSAAIDFLTGGDYDDLQCKDYKYWFEVREITCFPYKWEIFDGDKVLVADSAGITESDAIHYYEQRLEYNKDYTLIVTDGKGNRYTYPYTIRQDNDVVSYHSAMSECISDPDPYILIYGLYGQYGQSGQYEWKLEAGARIRFIKGPQNPVHPDVVLTEDINYFYPFSQDYHDHEQGISIASGNYAFEITSKCGDIDTLKIDYTMHIRVDGFTYVEDRISDVCNETRIYPQGKVYDSISNVLNTSPEFIMIESPDPSQTDRIVQTGEYFSLSQEGEYVFGIIGRYDECYVETRAINYESNELALDVRSSYVCETGSPYGHIFVQAKGGQPPYTYKLFEADSVTLVTKDGLENPNTTGVFEYGAYQENYAVKIYDACESSRTIGFNITTLDQIALVEGPAHLGKGETIDLSCLILGATEYEWNGPLGFSSNERTPPGISDVTTAHSGEYIVTVKPAGCEQYFKDTVLITVYDPPAPAEQDTILCQADEEHHQLLPVNPLSDDYSIKWYDKDGVTYLPEIPSVDVRKPGEYVFYISHLENDYHLYESDKSPYTVRVINSVPEKNPVASGWSCANGQPEISITNMVDSLVYTVYPDASGAQAPIYSFMFLEGMEEPIERTLNTTVTDDVSFYLKTSTVEGCTLPEGIIPIRVDVTKITMQTETLPVYKHDVPYSVQLRSDADGAVYTTADILLGSITLSQDGLISGIVPESVGFEEVTFDVTVTDKNGCDTTKKYILRSCGPPPAKLDEPLQYCSGTPFTLEATELEGLTLQWYDMRQNKLPGGGTPPTDIAGEQIYSVSRINTELQCETGVTEVKVKINPLPQLDFNASDIIVCYGNAPVVGMSNLHDAYIYNVYSGVDMTPPLASISGETSADVTLETIPDSQTSYYIYITDSLGCVSLDRKEVIAEVIKLYIEPSHLPPYIKNVDYEQLLVSNANSPMFTLVDGKLPAGLTLNASGLIYGNVPVSYFDSINIATVEVRDSNGCRVEREYIFNGNIFVPKVFTPNGDGVNDIFMRGCKMVIFDRLGTEISNGDDGWDGYYKGKPVADDIYFYRLEYIDSGDGSLKLITGYVGVHH
jgi:gliding motility-associated-like protein